MTWNNGAPRPARRIPNDWLAEPHKRPRITLPADLKISFIVPWTPGCAHREAAWRWVRNKIKATYLGAEIVGVSCGTDKTFRKASAMREAGRKAKGDVLVFTDADVWSPSLPEALDVVGVQGGNWCSPAFIVHRLDQPTTAKVLSGALDLDDIRPSGIAKAKAGGIVVLSRKAFERCPPDARFVGWGCEDGAWGMALEHVVGPPHQIRDVLWHLYHPRELPEQKGNLANPASEALYARYMQAVGNPAAMRRLVEESLKV